MKNLPKAILIEDEPATTLLIQESLNPFIQVLCFTTGEEGMQELEKGAPNIIILDLNLPDMNGIQILKDIRKLQNFKETPILILTSSNSAHDELLGHEYGVTEYLRKPIEPILLKKIVEKNLSRTIKNKDETLVFKGIHVDLKSMTTFIDDKEINLTQKELKILIYLLQNKERVISKEQIFEQVWKNDSDSLLRTVEMHISSLRKKLTPHSQLLKTIRGIGYSLKI